MQLHEFDGDTDQRARRGGCEWGRPRRHRRRNGAHGLVLVEPERRDFMDERHHHRLSRRQRVFDRSWRREQVAVRRPLSADRGEHPFDPLDLDDREDGRLRCSNLAEAPRHVCLSPRLQLREARRAVHLRIPLDHEVPRRRRAELLFPQPTLEASLEDDLEARDAVHVGLGIRDLVHVQGLEPRSSSVRDPDRFRETRRRFRGGLPRGQTGDVDFLLEVFRIQRAAMVRAKGLELFRSDADRDDVRGRRVDCIGDTGDFRRQPADDRQDLDRGVSEVDLVHQPFLSEIISSTSSESFIRRNSSRAITGMPRMVIRTGRRTTNMTESFSTTRLMSETIWAFRSSALSASPTPVRRVGVARLESASNGLRAVGRTAKPSRWRRANNSRSNPSKRCAGASAAARSESIPNGSTGRTRDSCRNSSRRIATSIVADIPSRYIWIVRRVTPAMSARVPRDTSRSSRRRRSASVSRCAYRPPGAENRKGGTPSSRKSAKVRRERIGTPKREYRTPSSSGPVPLRSPTTIGEPSRIREMSRSSRAVSLFSASTFWRTFTIKSVSSRRATRSKQRPRAPCGCDKKKPVFARPLRVASKTRSRFISHSSCGLLYKLLGRALPRSARRGSCRTFYRNRAFAVDDGGGAPRGPCGRRRFGGGERPLQPWVLRTAAAGRRPRTESLGSGVPRRGGAPRDSPSGQARVGPGAVPRGERGGGRLRDPIPRLSRPPRAGVRRRSPRRPPRFSGLPAGGRPGEDSEKGLGPGVEPAGGVP